MIDVVLGDVLGVVLDGTLVANARPDSGNDFYNHLGKDSDNGNPPNDNYNAKRKMG